jgi:hypothetical protein
MLAIGFYYVYYCRPMAFHEGFSLFKPSLLVLSILCCLPLPHFTQAVYCAMPLVFSNLYPKYYFMSFQCAAAKYIKAT